MSCKQVSCVHLYLTNNYFFSCCVLLLVFENFVSSILLCFLSLLNMIVLNSFTEHILYKFIQKCHNLLHQTTCIFTRFWLTSQMQRTNQFFPSTGGRRNSKKLSFRTGGLSNLSPVFSLSHVSFQQKSFNNAQVH